MLKSTAERYGAIPVTIHWLVVALILVALCSGFQAANSLDSVAKAGFLRVHIPVTITVLPLTPGILSVIGSLRLQN